MINLFNTKNKIFKILICGFILSFGIFLAKTVYVDNLFDTLDNENDSIIAVSESVSTLLKGNGGTTKDGKEEIVIDEFYGQAETVHMSAYWGMFTREGYNPYAVSKEPECEETMEYVSTKENQVLYVCWQKNTNSFSVIFNGNGGTNSKTGLQYYEQYCEDKCTKIDDAVGYFKHPNGLNFKYWSKTPSCEKKYDINLEELVPAKGEEYKNIEFNIYACWESNGSSSANSSTTTSETKDKEITIIFYGNDATNKLNKKDYYEQKCTNKCTKIDDAVGQFVHPDGLEFKYWSSKEDCKEKNKVTIVPENLTKDTKFYACWKENSSSTGSNNKNPYNIEKTFYVTFDLNGGSFDESKLDNEVEKYNIYRHQNKNNGTYRIYYFEENTSINLPIPEKSGNKFLYWVRYSDECKSSKAVDKVKDLTAKKKYKACWESSKENANVKKDFKITFNGNGATNDNAENSKKDEIIHNCTGSCGSLPESVGYFKHPTAINFLGWSTTQDCNEKTPIDVTQLTKDTTFYACWELPSSNQTTEIQNTTANTSEFTVIFDGNGGKAGGKLKVEMQCPSTGCITYNEDIGKFSKSGAIFEYWSLDPNCSKEDPTYPITKGDTYYACWKEKNSSDSKEETKNKTYRLAFNQSWGTNFPCANGYSNVVNGKKVVGYCYKDVKALTEVLLPTTPAYNRYEDNKYRFIGWSNVSLVKDENGNDITVCTSDAIIRADEKYIVSSDKEMYACYREDINATRYALKGASADINTIACGTALNITNCVTEYGNEFTNYCFYNNDGVTGKVYRDKLVTSKEALNCSSETKDIGWRYGTISAIRDVEFECGAKLYITTCNDEICNFTGYSNPGENGKTVYVTVNGTVNRKYLKTTQGAAFSDTKNCPKIEVDDKGTETTEDDVLKTNCKNEKSTNVKTSITKKICFNVDSDFEDVKKYIIEQELVSCVAGKVVDERSIRGAGREVCDNKVCERNIVIECKDAGGKGNISLSTTTANVSNDGFGTVTVKASSANSSIVGYYLSEEYEIPTTESNWVTVTSDTFTVTSTPGNKYIWVKDSNGTISNVATVAVRDGVNVDTTLKILKLSDSNNQEQVLSYVKENSNDEFALLSNNTKRESLIAKGFDSFVHEYKINVESPTITVYATLTSSDSSYVDGYGPRTVNLKYGLNTILIKIRNKDGKIRTYTIIANRTDDRSADNTLNDISLSAGKIDFNANVTEYKISVPTKTTIVKVDSKINSDLAHYVPGYGPGEVLITGDTAVKLIKVESQTGSIRTYVLTFIKGNSDKITDESLKLSSLSIPGVNLPFESSISNYNVSVDYSSDIIDIYPTLRNDESIATISIKRANSNRYTQVSNTGIKLDVGENFVQIKVTNSKGEESNYRLTIIRKEYGLGISNDTTLKDLSVLGYKINFNPKTKEYSVKIKREKSLVITAVPESNRAEVFIRGNEELTGFSTVRIKVVAENGDYETYSIDIKKDPFNKVIEITAIFVGIAIIGIGSFVIIKKKKNKQTKDYYRD